MAEFKEQKLPVLSKWISTRVDTGSSTNLWMFLRCLPLATTMPYESIISFPVEPDFIEIMPLLLNLKTVKRPSAAFTHCQSYCSPERKEPISCSQKVQVTTLLCCYYISFCPSHPPPCEWPPKQVLYNAVLVQRQNTWYHNTSQLIAIPMCP